ncbi:MAG: PqqD family protein [Bacteroidales bacterium]|nr:PqqD family protein [Bacteroidales bacterium]
MRINPKHNVMQVCNENIIFLPANGTVNMNCVVALNPTALALYNALKDIDFTLDDAVSFLTREYQVDEPTARRDAQAWLDSMQKADLLV